MCAIAGILSAKKRNLSRIFAMTSVQAHRGPDGDGHVFFETGDHAEFASQVIKIADDAGLARALVASGQQRLQSEFSVDRMMRRTSEVYEGAIERYY